MTIILVEIAEKKGNNLKKIPNNAKVKAQRFLKYRKSDHAEKENDMRKDLSCRLPHTARRVLALALTVP
ncbi:MAG: hypothetical protein EOM69_04585, partial [Clostridia bacterium]|nr:hypothetical protein [Clostridia bacterium]